MRISPTRLINNSNKKVRDNFFSSVQTDARTIMKIALLMSLRRDKELKKSFELKLVI